MFRRIGELYWNSSAGERIALANIGIGASMRFTDWVVEDQGMLSIMLYVLAFVISLPVSVLMIFLGGGGYPAFWRRLLDRFLPILSWTIVFALLYATRELT